MKEALEKIEILSKTFGYPQIIVSDRGTCFTSTEFEEYCSERSIRHHKITTGLPRANCQVERINGIIVPVLTKLSLDNPAVV